MVLLEFVRVDTLEKEPSTEAMGMQGWILP